MDDALRRRWCAALAILVQPDRAEEAGEALVKIVSMMADVPEAIFSSRSVLETVARCKRRTIVPSYSDIREAFGAWWRDHRGENALTGPDDGLSTMDRSWLESYRKWLPEREAKERDLGTRIYDMPEDQRPVAMLESLIQQQSAPAWRVIRRDRGEGPDAARGEPTDAEREYVTRLLHPTPVGALVAPHHAARAA
jgi:hypothetical protein